jgi:tight adherence protein C
LSLINLEIRGGKRRVEALRNSLNEPENEIRKLISILVQTDRFGTSTPTPCALIPISHKSRRHAEERGKAAKLVFPIFFCILPAMLVGWPGVLQIFKQLLPLMRGFQESQAADTPRSN